MANPFNRVTKPTDITPQVDKLLKLTPDELAATLKAVDTAIATDPSTAAKNGLTAVKGLLTRVTELLI